MAKNNPTLPLVTSVSTTLKKTSVDTTTVITENEVKAKKANMINIADKALDLFMKNLEAGKVEMTSTIDLDRVVRLLLLLSGEAESVTANANSETTITEQASVNLSKASTILNVDDPDVKSLYEKLYKGYNKANDEVK